MSSFGTLLTPSIIYLTPNSARIHAENENQQVRMYVAVQCLYVHSQHTSFIVVLNDLKRETSTCTNDKMADQWREPLSGSVTASAANTRLQSSAYACAFIPHCIDLRNVRTLPRRRSA